MNRGMMVAGSLHHAQGGCQHVNRLAINGRFNEQKPTATEVWDGGLDSAQVVKPPHIQSTATPTRSGSTACSTTACHLDNER
jgi:hypothetical protein